MRAIIDYNPTIKRVTGYPILKEATTDTGLYALIYFTGPDKGVLLHTTNPMYVSLVGKESSDWEEEDFKEFLGSVTLSNF